MNQLDPKAVWFFFLGYCLRWFYLIVLFGFVFAPPLATLNEAYSGVSESGDTLTMGNIFTTILLWVLGFALVFLVLCFVWAKLTYRFYRYELTEAGFRKELGVIYKKYVTIPYDRIQNVDIYRGILARLLGLSDLNIQTAGASASWSRGGMAGIGAEGRLPGLSRDVAEKLRDELIQRAKGLRGQGL